MQSSVTVLQISGIAALLQTSPRVGGPRPTSADRSRASHPWPTPAGLAVAAAADAAARMAGQRRCRRRTGAMVSKRARVPPSCHLPPRALGQLYGSGGKGSLVGDGHCAGAAAAGNLEASARWATAPAPPRQHVLGRRRGPGRHQPGADGREGRPARGGGVAGRGRAQERWTGTQVEDAFGGYCCRSEFRGRKSFRGV